MAAGIVYEGNRYIDQALGGNTVFQSNWLELAALSSTLMMKMPGNAGFKYGLLR